MAEALKATFFALRRRDRMVLLPAALVFVALTATIIGSWLALNWAALMRLYELFSGLTAGAKPDENAALGALSGVFALMGTALLFLFPLYLVVAAYEAACLRWMIRGEAPGLFGFTLDHDVWRVYGVYWCWFIAQFAVSTAASIVAMPIMFSTMGDVLRNPGDLDAMWRWQMSVQLPITLLQYLPLIFIGVRFGPAAATSIARRRFSFFQAWQVTRGRFWELLGSFALLWAIWLTVALAASAPIIVRMWPHVAAMYAAPTEANMRAYLEAYMEPETWLRAGLGYAMMLVAGLWLHIMSFGVNARAAMAAIEEGKIEPAPAT